MNNHTEIARVHRQQMAEFGVPAYRLLEAAEGPSSTGNWHESFSKNGAVLAEALIAHAVNVDAKSLRSISIVVNLAPTEAERAWECVTTSLEHARPVRGLMKLVLDNFGGWVEMIGPERRAVFFIQYPNLSSAIAVAGPQWMDDLLRQAVVIPPTAAASYLEFVAQYAHCSRDILRSLPQLARAALERDHRDYLTEILIIIPPAETVMDRDSTSFLPALAATATSLMELGGNDTWTRAIGLILKIGRQNRSCAFYTATKIIKSLRAIDSASRISYLTEFTNLVECIGVRVNGYSLCDLPKLYGRYGSARASEFTTIACKIGRSSGPSAGVGFLDRRTKISRALLPFP